MEIEFENEEEAVLTLGNALRRGVRIFAADGATALTLKQRGFVIVDRWNRSRELSDEEIEFIIARENGNVQ